MGSAEPLGQAAGGRDWLAEMQALVARHPTLTWLRPEGDADEHTAMWLQSSPDPRRDGEAMRVSGPIAMLVDLLGGWIGGRRPVRGA